jgi:hypothetical protein
MHTLIAAAWLILAFNTSAIAACESALGCAECDTAARREERVRALTAEVDWFLSIVEEVPEGIARQFREIDPTDESALRSAFRHPLWLAQKIQEKGTEIKNQLAYVPGQRRSYKSNIKGMIVAVQVSAGLAVDLSDYATANKDRRIVDVSQWIFRYTVLPAHLALFAMCLVDYEQP